MLLFVMLCLKHKISDRLSWGASSPSRPIRYGLISPRFHKAHGIASAAPRLEGLGEIRACHACFGILIYRHSIYGLSHAAGFHCGTAVLASLLGMHFSSIKQAGRLRRPQPATGAMSALSSAGRIPRSSSARPFFSALTWRRPR